MKYSHKVRLSMTLAISASALSLGLIAPTISSASQHAHLSGTITYAEAPQAGPTFILPFVGPSDGFSTSNMNDFQMMMYRPLFWFGIPGSAAYAPSLSAATVSPQTGSATTFTIKTKGWKFADGQTVNANSIAFFLNLYKATSATHSPNIYAGYVPAAGVPDGIASVTTQGTDTVIITMKTAVNANWLLYNYLSEITPMPATWDITSSGAAAGSGNCETDTFGSDAANTDCIAVLNFLRTTANVKSTFTGTMWQSGVDGPWKLTSIDTLGNFTMVPNPMYSGPVKAQVATFKAVAFTSTSAELTALKAGTITSGYVDPTNLTAPAPAPGVAGPNLAVLDSKYIISSGTTWSFNYDLYNLVGAPASAALSQLYIRQALQEATDQPLTIKAVMKGYGLPTYSPLPFGASKAISGPVANPYPTNVAAAKAAFKAHGWVLQQGIQECLKPGNGPSQCGAGIPRYFRMNLNEDQAAGSATDNNLNAVEVSEWKNIGVGVNVSQDTFSNVLGKCQGAHTGFDLCDWGGGWLYAPDYYPSGESLFQTGASSNTGGYTNATMDSLITASTLGSATLTAYENYAAKQLPVFFKPNGTGSGERLRTLKTSFPGGFLSNPLANWMPEYLHF